MTQRNFVKGLDVVTLSTDRVGAYWKYKNSSVTKLIKYIQIFYCGEGETNFLVSAKILNATTTSHEIDGLVPNKRYRVCVQVVSHSNTVEDYLCKDVSTQYLSLGAIIGCLIGSVLALSILIFLVVLYQKTIGRDSHRGNRCSRNNDGSLGHHSKRSRIDSAFESQFDSIAIREEMSMYDETSTVEASSYISTPPSARNQRSSQPKGILTNNNSNNAIRAGKQGDGPPNSYSEIPAPQQDDQESDAKQNLLNKSRSTSGGSSSTGNKKSSHISKLPTCVSEDETTSSFARISNDDDTKSPLYSSPESPCINNNIVEQI